MELIIQEITNKIISNFERDLEKLIRERKDISDFIKATKKSLDEVGIELVAEALEIVNEVYKKSKARKKHWTVKENGKKKTLTTIFGEVRYKRTYYRNNKTGEYSFLSDEAVGIKAHDKLDASLKAKLIEEAIYTSYGRSGEEATEAVELTSQTVMNSIRELGSVRNDAAEIKLEKRRVKTLYIEADEDHVSLQDKGKAEPKLVYVHEGKMKVSKDRYKLINPRYFSGVYSNSDELWTEVSDYIYEAYDLDRVEKIYLSGDGASWIKNGLGWIKGSIYVLDRYHLTKYVMQATAHMNHTTSIMWNYIDAGDKKSVKELLNVIISATESESKRGAVQEAKRYILGNWKGIMRQYDSDYVGCSAEGHVSHILSSRLSSRPLGWCKTGVDQMSRLRAFVANGGDIYELVMGKKKAAVKEARHLRIDQEIIKKRKQKSSHETIRNITILNIGKRTWAHDFLKSIRDA
jgi:hypothetical protein